MQVESNLAMKRGTRMNLITLTARPCRYLRDRPISSITNNSEYDQPCTAHKAGKGCRYKIIPASGYWRGNTTGSICWNCVRPNHRLPLGVVENRASCCWNGKYSRWSCGRECPHQRHRFTICVGSGICIGSWTTSCRL